MVKNVSTPTKRKKASSPVSPSQAKKKLNWSPGSIVSSAASTNNRSRIQNIDLVQTKVDNVYIGICTKSWAPSEASYLFELEKALNDPKDGSILAEEWKHVFGFFPRRDNSDIDAGTTAMKIKMGSKWDWKVCAVRIEDIKSIDKAGKHIANSFSKYLRKRFPSDSQDKYVFRQCFSNDPKPLNHHLLDLDVAKILRHLVSCNEDEEEYGSTKEEVMEDDELMMCFYGDPEYGRDYLGKMEDDDWENLLAED
jgi:hypothetical protein